MQLRKSKLKPSDRSVVDLTIYYQPPHDVVKQLEMIHLFKEDLIHLVRLNKP